MQSKFDQMPSKNSIKFQENSDQVRRKCEQTISQMLGQRFSCEYQLVQNKSFVKQKGSHVNHFLNYKLSGSENPLDQSCIFIVFILFLSW